MREVQYRINDKEYYKRMNWQKDRIKPDAVHDLLEGMPVFCGTLYIRENGEKMMRDDDLKPIPLTRLDSYQRMIVSFCEKHFRGEKTPMIGVLRAEEAFI